MRIVIAGAGAIGASIALQLALRGARDVVLADIGQVAGGSTAKAMGGVRQQFSTAAEVRLAQESIRFFEQLGAPFFHQVGYLFLASGEHALAELEQHAELQRELGVPVESLRGDALARAAPGVALDDVVGGTFCARDGLADPPATARELVRRAVGLGVQLREQCDATTLEADVRVIACGPRSAQVGRALGVELPVRPLCRQLLETGPLAGVDRQLPMVVEAETGFHFRPRGDRLVVAMADAEPRWGFAETVDESVFDDRLRRLRRRYPAAAPTTIERGWAGLYDMTPDAHPIVGQVGEGLYAACGFSGHGFMQSPAVGRALAELILDGRSSFDLTPYRLERFEGETVEAEAVVL